MRYLKILLLLALLPTAGFVLWHNWPDAGGASEPGWPLAAEDLLPKSFLNDGLGTTQTRMFMPQDSQYLSPDVRAALLASNRKLEQTPKDVQTLGEAYFLLGNNGHAALSVPYGVRYLKAGGRFDMGCYENLIRGLSQMALFDEALAMLKECEKLCPGFWRTGSSGVDHYFYKCMHACEVKSDLVAALEAFAAMNTYAPNAPYLDDYERACGAVVALAHKHLAKIQTLQGKLDPYWVFLAASQVQRIIKAAEKAGISPTAAMRAAAENMNKGLRAEPGALMRRAEQLFARNRDTETAMSLSRLAVQSAREKNEPKALFDALSYLAFMAHVRGDLETEYEAAMELGRIAEELQPGHMAEAKRLFAEMSMQFADYRGAAGAYAQSTKLAKDFHTNWFLHRDPEAGLNTAMCELGAAASAEPYLRKQAERVEKLAQGPGMRCVPYYRLGVCLSRQGRFDEALQAFSRSMQSNDLDYRTYSSLEIGRMFLAQKNGRSAEQAFDDAAKYQKMMKSSETQWAWQLGKAQSRNLQGDVAGARKWAEEAIRTIETQRASLKDFHRRRTLYNNKFSAYDLAVELALKRKDPAAAFALAEQSRARAFLDGLGAKSGLADPLPVVDLAALQQMCGSSCMVAFFSRPENVLAWVIRRDDAEVVELSVPAKELEVLVRKYHDSILEESGARALLKKIKGQDWKSAARALYDKIWAPIEAKLRPNERLCIIPHRMLHYVPFQGLYDGTSFLVEKHDLFYSPSGSAAVALAKRAPQAAAGVVIFDPVREEDPASVFSHTPTPFLKQMYRGATAYIGEQSTRQQFRVSANCGLVHITAHGSYNPWIPIRSGLHLAPQKEEEGLLTAEEIYGLKLEKVETLVLCSCVSSVGELGEGDEVTGVTRAFQVAGAQNVLGTLWPVLVIPTEKLMQLLHEELRARPHDPTGALCEAQRKFLKTDSHPAHWAAFEVNGSGGRP
ncbi:MAG TPA: CHAT domain-containing protein [Planctomycetota bacterium]|jgi:CHAT domain-containing protein